MLGTQNRLAWPVVSSDFWRDMQVFDGGRETRMPWKPAAVVAESDTSFTLRLAVPGIAPDSIEVDLDGDTLSIAGERAAPEQGEGEKVLLSELSWGRFHRSFRLGAEADREGVTASYRDGMLEIAVPKRHEARPRRIPVSTEA